ncbi:class I SAM-dependent methyltransferase [Phytohabitans houttuyneae]|uniref:Methyltransferase n=1 Tax=Phytohabitans houttuyneae TaxID=1076126 RepID=A0A6V8K9Z2_9ACTN|nr:methyltransferase domain-containing protein [Phytohabitans houttuyneae]GFJ82042.1 methyltransferase [Phytohabitans houttuyneae]
MHDISAGPVAGSSRYAFDNADEQGPRMLGLLAGILDGHSTSVLAGPHVRVGPGWRCLDVGPGAGSITGWLSERVGPDGEVTALDLQPDHVTAGGNVTVTRGDVRFIDLPKDYYDLIHFRLVLVHLSDPDRVLERVIRALAPGGRLVVSEWDVLSRQRWLLHATSEQAAAAFDAFQKALARVLRANGADLGWAARVPIAMLTCGLELVHSVAFSELATGGEPACLLHESNSLQLERQLVGTGLVTADQLTVLREAMWDPQTLAYSYQMFTTVGRRPDLGCQRTDR